MMSAAPSTTERGPKTTKRAKTAAGVKTSAEAVAKERAAVEAEIADWISAGADSPAAKVQNDPLAAWEAARQRLVAERKWMAENVTADTPASYFEATQALLLTPAPNGDALAYKLGVLSCDVGIMVERDAHFDEVGGRFPPNVLARLTRNQDEAAAFLACYNDARRLGPASPKPDTEAWTSARDAYLAARRIRREALDTNNDPAWNDFFSTVPQELVHATIHYDRHFRWNYPDALLNDPLVSADRRQELLPKLEQALKAFGDFCKSPTRREGLDDDALDQREWEAQRAWLALPAPSVAAVAYKMRLASVEADDDKMGLEEPGFAAFSIENSWDGRQQASHLRELLRLAGEQHPLLADDLDFGPRAWIDEFEALGGVVTIYNDDLLICHPPFAPSATSADARAMIDELREASWSLRAVFLAAQQRRVDGGDRVFTPVGDYRAHGGYDYMLRRLTPPLAGVCGYRIARVTRVSFSRGPTFFPGSLAESGVLATCEEVVLGPDHPTHEDLVRKEGEEFLRVIATETDAGRAAVTEVVAFDAHAILAEVQSVAGQYVDERHGLMYFDPGHPMNQGPVHSRDAPSFSMWRALAPWQKRLVCRAASEGIRRLKVDEAVARLAADRAAGTVWPDPLAEVARRYELTEAEVGAVIEADTARRVGGRA